MTQQSDPFTRDKWALSSAARSADLDHVERLIAELRACTAALVEHSSGYLQARDGSWLKDPETARVLVEFYDALLALETAGTPCPPGGMAAVWILIKMSLEASSPARAPQPDGT